jgi:hypothetical protein
MRIFVALSVLFLSANLVSAQQGFNLAPGEVLVAVDGVPVQQASYGYTQQRSYASAYARSGGGLAQSKANAMARMGRTRHVGGGFGGGRYEGVGYSSSSAQAAIRNCCYWGRRQAVDIGVARGARGYYACVIYR